MTDRILVPMGKMTNVFYGTAPDNVTTRRVTNGYVDPFMVPLIDALTRKHPTWQFVTRGYGEPHGDDFFHKRFTIVEFGDELGWVDKDTNWRSGVRSYEFNGPRLSAKRDRGNSNKTKGLKKALKLINENIYGLTLFERTNKARSAVNGTISNLSYRMQNKYVHTRNEVADAMVEFAMKRWDEFMAMPMTDKTAGARLMLLDTLERNKGMQSISQSHQGDRGAIVFEAGGQFYTQGDDRTDQQCTGPYTLEQLPDVFKAGIGLLRLVPVGEMVDHIGVRVEENIYYVANALKELRNG